MFGGWLSSPAAAEAIAVSEMTADRNTPISDKKHAPVLRFMRVRKRDMAGLLSLRDFVNTALRIAVRMETVFAVPGVFRLTPSRAPTAGWSGWACPRGPLAQRLNDGSISAAALTRYIPLGRTD